MKRAVDVFNGTFAEVKYISFTNSDIPFPSSTAALRNLVEAKDPAVGILVYYLSREDGDGGWRQKLFDNVEKSAEAYKIPRCYPRS
ncbi:hypothetical protein BDU57DRAFT_355635 [Ampelomyces quisqualis]|uniref:Uncharacterized protein n=1 Tax=Ampelomyces quisqualis TaxID=50730 RepID=A0A6A5QDI0_AMPQU|nr:hypothetical protein BDU57DRAFT_355635 [Ampelomyces quisqualis]